VLRFFLLEAIENFPNRFRGMNGRNDAHSAAAVGAFENVNRKNSLHQFGPGIIPGPASAFLL
jgi:hypothetical protein